MIRAWNVTVYASDLRRSMEFYRDRLGLEVLHDAGGHYVLMSGGAAPGVTFGLHPTHPGSPKPGSAGAVAISVAVDRPLEEARRALQEAGVDVDAAVSTDGPLRRFALRDPDGLTIWVNEPPGRSR